MSQTVRRNSALDLSRFLAALIVFIGHFVWFDQYFSGWQENRVLGVFRSRNQSVLYFFALSGFVLSVSAKSINLRWLLARAFRLMPVYLLCFILPLVIVKIMVPEEYASYSQTGILLGLIASQSLFAQFYLAGANSPLWSLSVEIWLSIGLLVLHHISRKYVLFSLLVICEVLNYFYFQPIVNGLTFFLIGIILARINKLSIYSTLQSLFFKLTFLAITFGYWLLIPILGVSVEPKRLLDLAGVSATMLFFESLRLKHNIDEIGYRLGARSYSLYAVHSPILRLHSEFFDLNWGNQLTIGQLWIYFISCIAMVLIATEIIFKFVELPAINYARNFRTAN